MPDSVIVEIGKYSTFQSLCLLHLMFRFVDVHVPFNKICSWGRQPRMKDHTGHNTQPTSVGDHCRGNGHVIRKNNVEVLAREEGWFKCKVREAIEIKTRQPTINRDQGSTCPRSTANYYHSHIIVIIRPAIIHPWHRSS